MDMTASAEGRRDRSNIRSVLARPHAVISPSVSVVPDDAKRVVFRESLTDLTGQYAALYRRDHGALELDHHGLSRQLAYDLAFVPENSAPFLFQFFLGEMAPQGKVEGVGSDRRINFTAGWQGPGPQILVLNVFQEPGNRLVVSPFPSKHRSGFFLIEIGIGQSGQSLLCCDVMIEDEERLCLFGQRLELLATVAEIDHHNQLTPQRWRRISVFHGDIPSRWKTMPQRP